MSAQAFTDETVAKVEAHGVYRIGYPDRAASERLIKQLRDAISAERAAVAELIEACRNLIEEWDGDYSAHSKFDPSEGENWELAETRFRAAIAKATANQDESEWGDAARASHLPIPVRKHGEQRPAAG